MAQRKLAAIMFADIVGYNTLLRSDENQAFKKLRDNHLIHKNIYNCKIYGFPNKNVNGGMTHFKN